MKTLITLIVLVVLVAAGCEKKSTSNILVEEITKQRGYSDRFIENFRCGVFVPPSYNSNNKYPLIIYLHGHTDTTTWNLRWYNEPLVSTNPCVVLTPKCPVEEIYGWGDSWDPRTSPMMAKVYEMLEIVEDALSIDPNRYYIHGTSMGGIGTYGALGNNPEMFAAAYIECGAGNVEIAPLLINIPLWLFHGSEDNIVPVHFAREMYEAVHNAGGTQIRYTEYEGVEHNTWDYTPNETTLIPWLLAQRKGITHNVPENIQNFAANINGQGHVFLEWDVPGEEVAPDNKVWFTRIYRNNLLLAEVYNNQTNFTDSLAGSLITYEYRISAVNYYFKESSQSPGISLYIP
ncbi:MAG: prolyl oligopeptidase family serine peptidase [Bacteroidales bacterium]|nr:prolyl oligopeptidase family serine peptidase [Bacteroidales bacterium]